MNRAAFAALFITVHSQGLEQEQHMTTPIAIRLPYHPIDKQAHALEGLSNHD